MTFTPLAEGAYRGTVTLKGSLVVSNIEHPLTTMQLSGRGEAPRLCLSPPSLDYGCVVSGAQISLPLELSNDGSCTLPIRVTLNTEVCTYSEYASSLGGAQYIIALRWNRTVNFARTRHNVSSSVIL